MRNQTLEIFQSIQLNFKIIILYKFFKRIQKFLTMLRLTNILRVVHGYLSKLINNLVPFVPIYKHKNK